MRHVAFDSQLALLENSLSRYTRNLVRHLLELRPALRVSLMVFSNRSAAELHQDHDWVPPGAEFVVMKGKETPHQLSLHERLRRRFIATPRRLRQIGAQIFHGHYADFPIPNGFKVVSTLHDVFQWLPELERMRGPLVKLRRALDKWLYRRATLISVSDSTLNDFLRYLDPDHSNIKRIYSGNDPIFRPEPQPLDTEVLRSYHLVHKNYFLYIGDLSPRKNVETLILAFKEGLTRLPSTFQLALSKGHWTGCPVRELVHSLGIQDRVKFLGHVPETDLPSLYRGGFAFAFPSLYEGFGFPPIEAMASGIPVLSTNHSALAEIVGPAGLTFERKNIAELRDLLIRIASDTDLYDRCVTRGLSHSAQFCWASTARQVLELYEDVLTGNPIRKAG